MQITELNLSDIKPFEKNPRKNDEAVKYVSESIKQFGFKVPIVVDDNYEIITGHTRLEASKLLGLKKVPIIKTNDLNKQQIKAFRLADNKVSELAEWDIEKLEEELKNIKNINVELLGFINNEEEINWDDIEDLNEEIYEEPEHKMMECPYCNHIDRSIHFKKV